MTVIHVFAVLLFAYSLVMTHLYCREWRQRRYSDREADHFFNLLQKERRATADLRWQLMHEGDRMVRGVRR